MRSSPRKQKRDICLPPIPFRTNHFPPMWRPPRWSSKRCSKPVSLSAGHISEERRERRRRKKKKRNLTLCRFSVVGGGRGHGFWLRWERAMCVAGISPQLRSESEIADVTRYTKQNESEASVVASNAHGHPDNRCPLSVVPHLIGCPSCKKLGTMVRRVCSPCHFGTCNTRSTWHRFQ